MPHFGILDPQNPWAAAVCNDSHDYLIYMLVYYLCKKNDFHVIFITTINFSYESGEMLIVLIWNWSPKLSTPLCFLDSGWWSWCIAASNMKILKP